MTFRTTSAQQAAWLARQMAGTHNPMVKTMDYVCKHAYASAPPSPRVNYGKPARSLSRCPDTELRRRGYGFIGRWTRADAGQIAEYLRGRGCVVVLKPGRGRLEYGGATLWAKRMESIGGEA